MHSHLRQDDKLILGAVGNTLGYLDISSQQLGIDLEREHIHMHISNLDKDLSNRMRCISCQSGGTYYCTFMDYSLCIPAVFRY